MISKLYIVVVVLLVIFFASCEKTEEYSEIPEINYKDFYLTSGVEGMSIATANLVFSFVDGDGDIGNFNNPDDENDSDSLNMFIFGSYRNGSDFVPFYTNSLNLPFVEGGVYRKSIQGDIKIEIDLTIQTPDTLFYSFYMIDRAGHQSNTETTPVLIISKLLEQL